MKASIIIRTYNEEKHLSDLLTAIEQQDTGGTEHETVIVDSGSSDQTLEIAQTFGCRITHIPHEEFSYGRSLNLGCAAADGDVMVFISGHCIPARRDWLLSLIGPLGQDGIVYTYGSQIGDSNSKLSEKQIFAKYFPEQSRLPQQGYFCNNANAALLRDIWQKNVFDETLTGLEDMHLAKRLTTQDWKIGYVAEASVYHLHNETWPQVKRRFEREAIALQYVMPEVHINFVDFVRYFSNAVILDSQVAAKHKMLTRNFKEIVLFRLMQFWGAYRGNHIHRTLSKKQKEAYFYPKRH